MADENAASESAAETAPGKPEDVSVRYERTDVSFRWIFGIIVASAVVWAIVQFAVMELFADWRDREATIRSSHFPLAPSGKAHLPPEPRLEQVERMAGIEEGNVNLRQREKEAVLNSYGAEKDGYVHIPIDRAMDLLADKLPVRKDQPTAAQARRQNGLVNAGESNSGRMFRGPHD